MKYDPKIHHRKLIHLKNYDYSRTGLYFVTICTQNRECLFGEIENDKMILNDAGKNVNDCWLQIINHFPDIKLHEYIIMPNHVHGIIEITSVGANNHSSNPDKTNAGAARAKYFSPLRSASRTIGSIVRVFKIGVTKWFRQIWGINFQSVNLFGNGITGNILFVMRMYLTEYLIILKIILHHGTTINSMVELEIR